MKYTKKEIEALNEVSTILIRDKGTVSAIEFGDSLGLNFEYCKPCETRTPTLGGYCFICGTPETPEEILIADFMGLDHIENDIYNIPFLDEGVCAVEEFLFKEDWSWLMKLVDKIEATSINDNDINVTIGGSNYCVIQDSHGELVEINVYASSKILTVYANCVEFIKWYNEFSLK